MARKKKINTQLGAVHVFLAQQQCVLLWGIVAMFLKIVYAVCLVALGDLLLY